MKALLALLVFGSTPAWACTSFIAESEIPRALALQAGAGSKVCGASDPCICFEGVDWETAEFNGVTRTFSVNAAKLASKQSRLQAEAATLAARKTARDARRARLATTNPDAATTVMQLRAMVKDLLDEMKDQNGL